MESFWACSVFLPPPGLSLRTSHPFLPPQLLLLLKILCSPPRKGGGGLEVGVKILPAGLWGKEPGLVGLLGEKQGEGMFSKHILGEGEGLTTVKKE